MGRFLVVALAAALLAAWFVAGRLQAPPDTASEIAHALMSPFCPGLTLAACPSGASIELRAAIADRLAKGEAPAAITESLARQYGDRIHAAPEPRGVALALWFVPAAFALAALSGLLASGRVGRVGTFHEDAGPSLADGPLASRLDGELEQLG